MNGDPLFYILTSQAFQCSEGEPNFKKPKTKKELIERIFKDYKVNSEDFSSIINNKLPVVLIDVFGRVLWMNEMFKNVNLLSEEDLYESLVTKFGFEVFEQGLDKVIKDLPEEYKISNIEFVIFNRFTIETLFGFFWKSFWILCYL